MRNTCIWRGGRSAISEGKLKFGPELVILGMSVKPSYEGVQFVLSQEKALKYGQSIALALQTGHLSSGEAVKLGGRLMFSTQHLFYRMGRALIKPVYAQKCSK
jgi:hypothetical protein